MRKELVFFQSLALALVGVLLVVCFLKGLNYIADSLSSSPSKPVPYVFKGGTYREYVVERNGIVRKETVCYSTFYDITNQKDTTFNNLTFFGEVAVGDTVWMEKK